MRAAQGPGAAGALACELCQAHRPSAAPAGIPGQPRWRRKPPGAASQLGARPCRTKLRADPERLASPIPCLGPASRPPRRLRILCLHGFRQTGGKLRGHWAGLIRRLGDLADFTFVDAPHALPLYSPRRAPARCTPRLRLQSAAGCPLAALHSAWGSACVRPLSRAWPEHARW